MPTVRVHHADGLWLADLARLAASARNAGERNASMISCVKGRFISVLAKISAMSVSVPKPSEYRNPGGGYKAARAASAVSAAERRRAPEHL